MRKEKHNWTWFKNRIGKKIYCTDHENGNKDWTECKGIITNMTTCTNKNCCYKWQSRVERPVSCPNCRQYLKANTN